MKILELHHYEKQLIKYTKGHFKRDLDYKNDVKYFDAELYGLSVEDTPDYSVFNMVIGLYQELIDTRYIREDLKSLFGELFKRASWNGSKNNINYDDVIEYMLVSFQGLQIKGYDNVLDNIELGETDATIFAE